MAPQSEERPVTSSESCQENCKQKSEVQGFALTGESSRQCSAAVPFPNDWWLVLPVHHEGHSKRQDQRVLLSMWQALHPSEVVAGPAEATEIVQQADRRSKAQDAATEDQARQGQSGTGNRSSGTIWDGTKGSRRFSASTEGQQFERSVERHIQCVDNTDARRDSGQVDQDRPSAENAGDARCNGEGRSQRSCFDGEHESFAERGGSFPTAEPDFSQGCHATPQSREGQGCMQSATCFSGCTMVTMEGIHVQEVHGTRRTLQGAKVPTGDKATRVQGQSSDNQGGLEERGESTCSRGGRTYHSRTRTFSASEFIPELQSRGMRPSFRRRVWGNGSHGTKEGKTCSRSLGSTTIPDQEAQDRGGPRLVKFNPQVSVVLHDEANNRLSFQVCDSQLPIWRCKPWSLYGGAFTLQMQKQAAHLLEPQVATHPTGEEVGVPNRQEAHVSQDSATEANMMVAAPPTKQIPICTFGLAGGYVGRRDLRVHEGDGLSLHDRRALLHDHIRALWHDYAGDYIQIHPVDFTDREDQCEHFVVELMPPLNREADIPVLWIDKGFQEDQELRVGKTACYVPRRSHVQQVIHHASRQHVCTSLVQGQCILKYKHRLLLPDDDVGVEAGGFFECLYDIDETSDHILLLQTAGPSPMPAWEKGDGQGGNDTHCLQDAVDLPTDFHAERLDYDPDVASVRHYYEGTGQAPPSRTFFGRQLSQEWIAAHQEPPDGGLWVQTYGLHYDSVGNRKHRVEYATIDSLMEAMQDLWPEYMDFDQRAYAVNPQPDPIDSNVFHVLIEFMERGELAPRDHVPVVQDWMDWTEADENHHRQAQYIDETATRQELLHAADWRECEPEGRHVCDVWIGDQRCPWQGEHGAQHGCFVTMTRHAPIIVPAEFDFDRFPDIVLCLRIMLGRRLGRPGMGIALVGHVVDLFGHAQGWRMQEVDRAIPQDPVRLVQELLDLWPGEDFRQIVFFPHLLVDLQEEYHFALVQPSDGMVTILVQGEIGHVDSTAAQSFHHAIMIPARATLELVMSRLGLQRYFQADCQLSLQCQGLPWTFVNPCYDGLTLELDIQLPGQAPQAEEPDGHQVEGTPEVDEEDNVNFLQLSAYITPVGTGEYNHERTTGEEMPSLIQGSLDFKPIHNLLQWFDAIRPMPQWHIPRLCDLHPAAQEWSRLPWWDLGVCQEVAFYTDGSTQKDGSGSAVILFVLQSGSWYFGGYLARKLDRTTAHAAEIIALLDATTWLNSICLAQQAQGGDPIHAAFYFDAITAGYKMSGHWGGHSQPDHVRAGRDLRYMYETRYGCTCKDFHVKAHSGDPGNEFANSIATMATRGATPTTPNPATDHILTTRPMHALDWVWAVWKTEWAAYWDAEGHSLQLPPPPQVEKVANIGSASKIETFNFDTHATIEFKLLTANVLSLLPKTKKGHGTMGLARMEALQKQCVAKEYVIVGIQESRQKKPPPINQEHYWTFASDATDGGHFGTQLWFSKTLAYGWTKEADTRSKPLRFAKQHFRYLYQSPRILAMQVNAPGFRAVVISAHAPHTQAEDGVAELWWEELARAIPTTHQDWDIYVCIDANSRLGDITSDAVDGHQAETQDRNGGFFHDFLLAHRLWLPSTYAQYHLGAS